MSRIAINGFGRIGRHVFKAAFGRPELEIVGINDLVDTKTLAHLLKYDTAYPEFPHEVTYDEQSLIVDGQVVVAFAEKDPARLPWASLKVDMVIESSGLFRSRE